MFRHLEKLTCSMRSAPTAVHTCMCSTPSYEKHVSSTSARILTGWGVIRRRMFFMIASFTSSVSTSNGCPSFTCGMAGAHHNHAGAVRAMPYTDALDLVVQ